MDGDGDLDALVGSKDAARLWTNQGGVQGGQAGKFDDYAQIIASGLTRSVFLHDMDNDADLDAVFAWRNLVEIWHNNGRGHFTPAYQTFPFSRRHALAIGDFNADGRAEIFIAEETGYKVGFMPSP